MAIKEHRWRLHSGTFWNIHLISNSKRLGIFLAGRIGFQPYIISRIYLL
jgi:hypothetical protein